MLVNLDILILEAIEKDQPCFVCSGKLHIGKARIGYRIRPTMQNLVKYGGIIINNYMNHEVCCSSVCCEKITSSWENKKNYMKLKDLADRISESLLTRWKK